MTDRERQHLNPDNPLWQFAIERWQSKSFEEASLALQRSGWVVSHILVALWRAKSGHRWNGREPTDVANWRQRYTGPLRNMRQSLAKDETHSGVRQQVAAAELEAERIELAMWYSHFEHAPEGSTEGTTDNTIINDERSANAHSDDPVSLAALNLLTVAHLYHRGYDTSLLQALMLAIHPSLRPDGAETLLDACSNALEESVP